LLTHRERTDIDLGAARRQWDGYVAALSSVGWPVQVLPLRDDLPDSVFVEDTMVVHGDLAVVTHPGNDARVPETEGLDDLLRGMGLRTARIEPPARLDGGDVLTVGNTAYVGLGGRTNRAGIDQLAALLRPPVAVDIGEFEKLEGCVTCLSVRIRREAAD